MLHRSIVSDVLVEDAICEDCTSHHAAFQAMASTSGSARNVLIWGTIGGVGGSETFSIENLGVVGGTRPAGGRLLPQLVDGFSVRDAALESASAILSASSILDVRNGVVSNVVLAVSTAASSPANGTLENVAFLDVATSAECTGTCRLLSQEAGIATVLRRLLVANSPGIDAGFDLAFWAASGSGAGLVLDGILVDGWQGPIADHAWSVPTAVMTSATFGAGPCFHDNVSDGPSSVLLNLPPTAVLGVAPGFVDTATGRFDTAEGSPADVAGCGVRSGADAPGVRGLPWAWRISGLTPERMADDPDGDGVPTAPGAPPCANGDAFGCGDVCPTLYDPLQRDTDEDGIGDLCDDFCVGETTAITQVLPATPRIGSLLAIEGTGFGPSATVHFGNEVVVPTHASGRLLAFVPPLPIGTEVALQVVNPEGCRSLQQVILVPEAPAKQACGLVAAELLVLLFFRRVRARIREATSTG